MRRFRQARGFRPCDRAARGRGAVLLCALVATLALARASGAAPSNDECMTCHAGDGVEGKDGRPRAVAAEAFANSVHSTLDCVDCHTDASDEAHDDGLKKVSIDTCADCHADAVSAYRDGIHSRGRDGQPVAGCGSCHGDLHATVAHDDPASTTHWTHMASRCAQCHANRAVIEKYGIPVVQPVEAYLEGVHGKAVASGHRAAVCSDCHGSHAILPSSDPRSTTWHSNVPSTCGDCHPDVAEQYKESVHGVAAARGVMQAPVCTDCHGEHRILAPGDKTSPVFAANIPSQTCGRCHADTRLNAKYGLNTLSVSAFEDSFHGLALRAGKVDVANCASCHGVHGIFPASDPRSLVNPANLADTCGKCHPGAGKTFAIGNVHVSATTSKTRLEYWIRLAYIWLIVAVIGFMATHVGIDLVVKARHWPPPPHTAPARPRRRMSRSLRWQHGLVMSSFPILVYTGFALTYPESWWASPLLAVDARLGLRGIIHRCAAVVLLVGLGWHVVEICVNADLRRRLRGLWPSLADLRYFGARLAFYFAGRRHLPAAGPFSYVEKMEYWAFVWGMLIMTLTGVPLWFSSLSLRYLPKWITDVATAVHFYEAVLATLAILVWHLYWTVFDPEVYPMDWSWWTGDEPASRTRERGGGNDGLDEAEEKAAASPSASAGDEGGKGGGGR